MKLSDAERKVMELVWRMEGITAAEISQKLSQEIGWKKTTSYTMISVCIQKGYLRREDPKYRCYSLVSRQQVIEWETDELISNSYDNLPDLLVASLINSKRITLPQLERIHNAIRELEAQK